VATFSKEVHKDITASVAPLQPRKGRILHAYHNVFRPNVHNHRKMLLNPRAAGRLCLSAGLQGARGRIRPPDLPAPYDTILSKTRSGSSHFMRSSTHAGVWENKRAGGQAPRPRAAHTSRAHSPVHREVTRRSDRSARPAHTVFRWCVSIFEI
jgi:hypothetical protein